MKPPRGFTTEAQGTEAQELQESEDRQIVSGQRIDDDDDYVANHRTPKTKLRTLNTKGDSPQRRRGRKAGNGMKVGSKGWLVL